MGTRDTAKQDANSSERDEEPHVDLLPLVQGTGALILEDTVKGIFPVNFLDIF